MSGQNTTFGSGNDTYSGTGFDDTVFGGSGTDSLLGNDGNDRLFGEGDNDTIRGGTGNDTINGGAQNDLLFGNEGNDSILGEAQEDTIVGGLGADFLQGGNQLDIIITGASLEGGLYDDGARDTVQEAGNFDDIGYAGPDDLMDGGGNSNTAAGGGDTLYLPNTFNTVATGGSVTIGGVTYDQIFVETTEGANGTLDTIYATNWERFGTYTLNGVACFATGTRIATARGEVAVEDLRVGDLVVTAGGRGALQPVVWLGHAEVSIAKHPEPIQVQPILIKAGALAEGVPFRDLRVSPDHALFLDGRLVPAGFLVNGTTIIREAWCPQVTYWHVELPAHAVLLAEGAPAESYLDDGNRKHFDNGAIATLFKDFASERANGVYDREACYPVLRGGEALEAIRARLTTRAASLAGGTRRAARSA